MTDEVATETETESEGHKKADELAASTVPTEDTKAAEEAPLPRRAWKMMKVSKYSAERKNAE
jgi:hypothetical protein